MRRKGLASLHVTLGDRHPSEFFNKFQFRFANEELQLEYSFNFIVSPKNSMAGKARILVLGATGYM